VLDHPPYSPDLSPYDFNLFGPLKKALKGHRLGSDEDIKATVLQWFQQQPKEFSVEGIHWLVHQWDASTPMVTIFNSLYFFAQNNP
jgi:hypothetical protein